MSIKIIPMPSEIGVGITSFQPLPEHLVSGMKYEKQGIYHNYFFTNEKFNFNFIKNPIDIYDSKQIIIDGFSPNLNKKLHIGHMRNFVLANSLSRVLNAKPVAFLGASLGVIKYSLPTFNILCQELGYDPDIYYDVLMPIDLLDDKDLKKIPLDEKPENDEKDFSGTTIWNGPKGPVIVEKSDGKKTYAYWDLVFSKMVSPDFYITGMEQKEHFESLGLGEKHLPMGLVLGMDGKKLKSRTGDALSLEEALELVVSNIGETKENTNKKQLAWNVLIWNFLSVSREKNIKFNPVEWTKTDSGGMYISYTYARINSLTNKAIKLLFDTEGWDNKSQASYSESDLILLGNSAYFQYFFNQCVEKKDPSPLAHYAMDLAKVLNKAYESEKIIGGRKEFMCSMNSAVSTLGMVMSILGMFCQESV